MIRLLLLFATLYMHHRSGSIIINGSADHKEKNFVIGTVLHLSLSGIMQTDSVKLYIDRTPIPFSQNTAIVPTANMRMGEHTVHAFCYYNGQITDTLKRMYTLVSDIVPVKDTFDIIGTYPHDTMSFTQGLTCYKGWLYEGTGLKGRSVLMKVDLASGRRLQVHHLHKNFFGEGITLLHDKIYQITWKNHLGMIYDRGSLAYMRGFKYPWDGWGITTDGQQLFISTGSNRIYKVDPETFMAKDSIDVCDNNGVIRLLNELEMIDGDIYANILGSNNIVRIDPQTGKVKSILNLTGLRKELSTTQKRYPELNGIAHDPQSGRMFVTGKLWPKLFEIRRKPKS